MKITTFHSFILVLLLVVETVSSCPDAPFFVRTTRNTGKNSRSAFLSYPHRQHHAVVVLPCSAGRIQNIGKKNQQRFHENSNARSKEKIHLGVHSYNPTTSYSHNRKAYRKAGGILYKKNLLSKEDFSIIQKEMFKEKSNEMKLKLSDEISSSVANKRVGAQIPTDCETYKIFSDANGKLARLVNEIVGDRDDIEQGENTKMILSKDIPIEVRVYEKLGAGMEWHVDDVLFDPEQIEVVFCLDNTSNCKTKWKESSDMKIVEVETEPNSAIILKAGGVDHCVSSLKYGKRTIIKCVFVREDATFLSNQHTKQFSSTSTRTKNSKAKKKKRGKGS